MISKFLPSNEILKHYPFLTQYQLHYFLRKRDTNGLGKYVRKLHQRLVLIDVKGFEKWMNSKKNDDRKSRKRKNFIRTILRISKPKKNFKKIQINRGINDNISI